MSVVIFIVILLVLVIAHEFGHFIVAKKAGMRVDEFAFGFPPKIFGIKKGETEYNFNLLPIGGYVRIFGENPNDESLVGKDSPRSFTSKSKRVQIAVLLAGVTMNFLVAWLLFSIGFMSGMPSSMSTNHKNAKIQNSELAITAIMPDSPAYKSGLVVGDKIKKLSTKSDSTEVPSVESIKYFVSKHKDEKINVYFVRSGEEKTVELTPGKNDIGEPVIGIGMDMISTIKLAPHKAIWEGLKLSVNVFVSTCVGFYKLIANAVMGHGNFAAISGPVGIVGIVGDVAHFGIIYLLSFTAIISINLAVINLIPFPALDGGRILFVIIEKIKGSPIKPKIANVLNMIGFALLMLLMIIVTYKDITKLM